jgi:hypothetical protein
MALLAKTNNTIATIGRNIPIPFSETRTVSPDMFSERYTNNPNKIKFKIMFNANDKLILSFYRNKTNN